MIEKVTSECHLTGFFYTFIYLEFERAIQKKFGRLYYRLLFYYLGIRHKYYTLPIYDFGQQKNYPLPI